MSVFTKLKKDTFIVRETCDIELEITVDSGLSTGDRIEIMPPNSWLLLSGPSFTRELQAGNPAAPHFVEFHSASENAAFEISIAPCNRLYEKGLSRHGRNITAVLTGGSIAADKPVIFKYRNTFAPYISDKAMIYVKVNGKSPENAPLLTTLPGPAAYIRILVPSGARPDEEFSIRIISLDKFDNCSSTRYENQTLYGNDGKIIAENLNFTGSISVPVNISREGIYRFRLGSVVSNAVKISRDAPIPYWGDIHIHTGLSHDGQGENPYFYARHVAGLDFAAAADHWQALGDKGYELLRSWAENAYEPGKFVTLPADERNPTHWPGHHNLYFRDMDYFMANKVHLSGKPDFSPTEPWPKYDKSRAMLIPHHTGIAFGALPAKGSGGAIDLGVYNDEGLIPAMEIYSHHGQSEIYNPQHILAYEFNRMRNPERRGNTSMPGPYYAQDYWMNGKKLGIIASSDEHSGQGGRRHGGIAAVFADSLTREGIFDAIAARQSYATTGERILLEFTINGISFGKSVEIPRNGTAEVSLKVWGTDLLLRVEILRFRFGIDTAFVPILAEPPRPETMDAEYVFNDIIASDCVYYARVIQEPLEWPAMAWASPIWVYAYQSKI